MRRLSDSRRLRQVSTRLVLVAMYSGASRGASPRAVPIYLFGRLVAKHRHGTNVRAVALRRWKEEVFAVGSTTQSLQGRLMRFGLRPPGICVS